MVLDVYLAMAEGVWLYEPKTHKLLPYMKEDLRAQTGLQDFVVTAPLNLVCVAHGERMTDVTPEERRLYASVDASFIGQNVYLFCAAEGLATVFRGAVDGPKLGQTLKLPEQQFVTFAQTVGYCYSSNTRWKGRIAQKLTKRVSPPGFIKGLKTQISGRCFARTTT
jgi:nitroreductase